jgi:excisionase family DNA binding protein
MQLEPMSEIEHFVDVDRAAEFLAVPRRRVLKMARAGEIPGHPIGRGKRKTWRFRLSELVEAIAAEKPGPPAPKRCIIGAAVPGNRIGGIR